MPANLNPSTLGISLIIVASSCLFTMLAVNQINYLVHDDLYSDGLTFSYQWAMPYWGFSGAIMALSMTNIVLSLIASLHVIGRSRGENASGFKNLKESTATYDLSSKQQLRLDDFPSMPELPNPSQYELT